MGHMENAGRPQVLVAGMFADRGAGGAPVCLATHKSGPNRKIEVCPLVGEVGTGRRRASSCRRRVFDSTLGESERVLPNASQERVVSRWPQAILSRHGKFSRRKIIPAHSHARIVASVFLMERGVVDRTESARRMRWAGSAGRSAPGARCVGIHPRPKRALATGRATGGFRGERIMREARKGRTGELSPSVIPVKNHRSVGAAVQP